MNACFPHTGLCGRKGRKEVGSMPKYSYNVVMQTQLGPKRGTLRLQVEGTAIRGTLDILQKKETVSGELTGEGTCRLNGRIVTRMRTVDFTAEGVLDDSRIDLTIREPRNIFSVCGTASPIVKGGRADG